MKAPKQTPWDDLNNAQLRYQVNCFETHEGQAPKELYALCERRGISFTDWRDQGEIALGA